MATMPVYGLSDRFEMLRINTTPVKTTRASFAGFVRVVTCVVNSKAIRNVAFVKFIREAMNKMPCLPNSKVGMAIAQDVAYPVPALIVSSLIYLNPETRDCIIDETSRCSHAATSFVSHVVHQAPALRIASPLMGTSFDGTELIHVPQSIGNAISVQVRKGY